MQRFEDIDARRARLGITQRDLCRAADVNASTYSRCKEDGYQPTQRILRKLSKALDKLMLAKRDEVKALSRELDALAGEAAE
jgi:transcriptional regulator with XRE-family HTH domain